MFGLSYNFLLKFCDADNCEELEMHTDSFYLALLEEKLDDVILSKSIPLKCDAFGKLHRQIHCLRDIFFPERVATHTRNTIRRKQFYLEWTLDIQK